ncbi:MAG TPA: heparinase II/III family protein, partial [Candidatus Kapabacteria bacterium]|nr:heparinase II/III family protein [Candidatus Kapabacteria bacterium]
RNRAKYRGADAHNGIILGKKNGAEQRLNFGWNHVRPDAKILETSLTARDATAKAQYGEWPQHCRTVKLRERSVLISDRFVGSVGLSCVWFLHLAPEWDVVEKNDGHYRFQNSTGHYLSLKLRGHFEKIELAPYDFSPSYCVAVSGTMLRLSARNPSGAYAILLSIEAAA